MQKYKWILKSGVCNAAEIKELLLHEIGEESACFIAMMTDRFAAGHFERDRIDEIVREELLEVRVFNEKSEFLASRGSIGDVFLWRITDDSRLDEKDVIVSAQFIDINEEIKSEILENGNRTLFSTVGGKYSLPINEKQKRIKVKSYIHYDKDGMAKVVDSRVCCFTE